MKNIFKLKSGNLLYYVLSFFIPSIIMAIILYSQNVYWGSDTTILASDGFHQYVIFDTVLRNVLHGDGSIFYTFTSGLGLNFYVLMSYYLGSFFAPLDYFFTLQTMPDAVYLMTLLKFGCIGLSSYFSFSRLHPKARPTLILIFSVAFPFMSFITSQIELSRWLDVYILAPLIILGLQRLIDKKGSWLYYLSLTTLYIQNYYFGYMVSLFLIIYFVLQLSWNFKIRIKRFIHFAGVSLLAVLSSMVMLLPTILDLREHGESFTEIETLLSENAWWLDLFAKNIVGSYDTTKFGAIPSIFVGLIPLILAIAFFTIPSINKKVKLTYLVSLGIFIISFYLEPIDLAWQGFHAPNMFLHRYAWLFSLLIILIALESIERIKEIKYSHLYIILTVLIIGFFLTSIFEEHYDFLSSSIYLSTLIFLAIYAILYTLYSRQKLHSIFLASLLMLFSTAELSLNAYYNVNGLREEWNFPSREGYERNMDDLLKLLATADKSEDTFYRTERQKGQTGNDSMKYNYNGISQFSSIRNRASSSLLDKLGFKSNGSNLNLRYQNNTIISDSLFAIKYNLSTELMNKYGFDLIETSNTSSLYKNNYASQLAMLSDTVYHDFELSNNTLDNQTKLLNQLAGTDYKYFNRLESSVVSSVNTMDNRIMTTEQNNGTAQVTFSVSVPDNTQLYISMPDIDFVSDDDRVEAVVNDQQRFNYTTDDAFSFFDLGYFENAETILVTFYFPENTQVSFKTPNFYQLDTTLYQKAIDKINSKSTSVSTNKNKVEIAYSSENDSSLFITLPYDKGWSAKNSSGEKLEVHSAQDGLMKIDVPKGEDRITLTFIPYGFTLGVLLSLLGFVGHFLYYYINYLKQRNKEIFE